MMFDLLEPLARLFDWFNQTFTTQKEKSRYWNEATLELHECLGEFQRRQRLTEGDVQDIEDMVLEIEGAAQELAYVRGISDGAKLMRSLLSDDLPEQVLSIMNDLIEGKKEVTLHTQYHA